MAKVEHIDGISIFLDRLDAGAISDNYVLWMQDPNVLRFLADPLGDYGREQLSRYVAQANESPKDFLFGIFDKVTGVHIGNVKLGNIHSRHRFADLGIIIGLPAFWGKGIATEAIDLTTIFAFRQLKLNKIIAGILAPNVASYKAFLKAGYREVGKYERHYLLEGRYVDSFIVERCRRTG